MIVTSPLVLPTPPRPALGSLIDAMEKLSRHQRCEIARIGRRARAAKEPHIRRLTWATVAEVKRLAAVDHGAN